MSYRGTEERCDVDQKDTANFRDHLARYRFATRYVRNKRVLDIACGTGYGSAQMRDAGAASVLGVDLSTEAVAEAIRVYGPDYRVGSILDFDESRPFDVIVSFETIEHIDDYMGALRNLRRLLAEGGTLILSTPNRPVNSPQLGSLDDKPSNRFHVREFTTGEIEEATREAGFGAARLFGQKLRWPISSRLLRGLYAGLAYAKLIPGHFSAAVLPIRPGLEPRYCVLVCDACPVGDGSGVRMTEAAV